MPKKTGTHAPKTTVEQTFSFTAPQARSVMLVGDFTHWQRVPVSMHRRPDNTWTVTVKLEPGEHHYRFLVDGEWRDDPECTVRVPNPYGSHNATVRITETKPRSDG
jgi:1,4-alpha-glucan branching enzyme